MCLHQRTIRKEQLDEAFATNKFVNVHNMTPDHLKTFDKWQHEIYIEPSDGFMKYHLFTFGDCEESLTQYGYKLFDSKDEPNKSKDPKP